jgi:hypothetical protein
MPPRQKSIQATEAIASPMPVDPYGIAEGDFVHVITLSGAKHKSSEVLRISSNGITIRTSILGPTQSEVSFIPWSAIDGVGLIGKR